MVRTAQASEEVSGGGLLGTPAATAAPTTPIFASGTTAAAISSQAPGWALFAQPAIVPAPSNFGALAAAATAGSSEVVGGGSFIGTALSPLDEASLEKIFGKPLEEGSSVLKQSVYYFVLGVELEMEGLELSS
jgi:hypothetical protein